MISHPINVPGTTTQSAISNNAQSDPQSNLYCPTMTRYSTNAQVPTTTDAPPTAQSDPNFLTTAGYPTNDPRTVTTNMLQSNIPAPAPHSVSANFYPPTTTKSFHQNSQRESHAQPTHFHTPIPAWTQKNPQQSTYSFTQRFPDHNHLSYFLLYVDPDQPLSPKSSLSSSNAQPDESTSIHLSNNITQVLPPPPQLLLSGTTTTNTIISYYCC